MAVVTYCVPGDLLVGDIPTVDGKKEQFIASATDEIDSYLAHLYVTPVVVAANATGRDRSTYLTLKNICAQLASGRLITSLATAGEDTEVHQYGLLLINNALDALNRLRSGVPELPGATKHEEQEGETTEADLRGRTFNGDEASEVDGFYGMTTPLGIVNRGLPPRYYGQPL